MIRIFFNDRYVLAYPIETMAGTSYLVKNKFGDTTFYIWDEIQKMGGWIHSPENNLEKK